MHEPDQLIRANVQSALREDVGEGDLTAQLIAADTCLDMQLICREPAILCGRAWFDAAFVELDKATQLNWNAQDGDPVDADQVVCEITGKARALLTAERTALNFLQTLSATATVTHQYQQAVAGTGCRILDTRKTIPGLRKAQKYAVTCGGGSNHRMGLYDAYLLKENHLAAGGGIGATVERARSLNPDVLLEVEVETLAQLGEAIDAGVDRVLLDNFTLAELSQAVSLAAGRVELEASGNVTLENIRKVAQTGVDFISIGAITKHVQAIDFSLRFK